MTRHFYTTENIEKKVFLALSLFVMVFVFLYIYFVASTTVAIVDRNRIEDAITSTGGALSVAESEYLAIASKLTPAFISSLGFREITAPHFVSRTGLALSSQ